MEEVNFVLISIPICYIYLLEISYCGIFQVKDLIENVPPLKNLFILQRRYIDYDIRIYLSEIKF